MGSQGMGAAALRQVASKSSLGKAPALGNAGDRTAVGLGHCEELLPEEQSCGNAEG